MIAQPKPTGLVLVGFLTLCFLSGLAQADLHHSASDSLNLIAKFESDPVGHGQASGGGELELAKGVLRFPWATHHVSGSKPFLPGRNAEAVISSKSLNDDVFFDQTPGEQGLQKLSALNAANRQDMINEESLGDGPGGQESSRSLNATAVVRADAYERVNAAVGAGDVKQKSMRDLFIKLREAGASEQASDVGDPNRSGNYLDIDVHGISVQAINTIEGGNAVATSNIIIKPVQTVILSPEVRERLK